MSQQPIEMLKPQANQLAELLIKWDENQEINENEINSLKQQLGLSEEISQIKDESTESSDEIVIPDKSDHKNENVGIWKPDVNGKFYVRDKAFAADFSLWANVLRIPQKSQKKRITFIGESVARGFLYDPHYTPAAELMDTLNSFMTSNNAEVIDLAKSNLTMEELKEICVSSLKLEPDVAVIFAGNNWTNANCFSDDEITQMLTVMETNNYFELKNILETKYRKIIADLIKHIKSVFKDNHIPVVLIIPEYNLMDWKCNGLDRLFAWPNRETDRWFKLRDEVESAIEANDIKQIELLASEMIRINPTSPLPYRFLAQYHLENNQLSEAKKNLELAQDAKMFRFSTIPGSTSVIKQTLREEANKYNIPIIDLPEHFAEMGIPGKELFIDYCHLTEKGIRISMELTAREVIKIISGKDIPLNQLEIQKENAPDLDVKSRAHFFAAIHNAHKGQPYEVLYYHCLQAIQLSDTMIDYFIFYIDMASRHTPWSILKSCEAMITNGELSQYMMLLQPDVQRIMDVALVDAMGEALKTKGIDIKEKIQSLRITEHGIQNRKVNLLESYYHLDSYVYTSIFSQGPYRSYDAKSHFYLLSENSTGVQLHIVCRTPLINTDDAAITINVNNSYSTSITVSRKWNNSKLHIPSEHIKRGINNILIRWPTDLDLKKKKEKENKIFKININDQLKRIVYPAYGEIHKFTAIIQNS